MSPTFEQFMAGLQSELAEQLAGIAPPVMFPPADPERLHDITPAPWANGHEGAEL